MALRRVALRCIALRCAALLCVALHGVALRCIAFHCVALLCVALHCGVLDGHALLFAFAFCFYFLHCFCRLNKKNPNLLSRLRGFIGIPCPSCLSSSERAEKKKKERDVLLI